MSFAADHSCRLGTRYCAASPALVILLPKFYRWRDLANENFSRLKWLNFKIEYLAFSLMTGKPSESAKGLSDLAAAFNSSIVVKNGE